MLSDRDAATKLSTDDTDYTDASEPHRRSKTGDRTARHGESERLAPTFLSFGFGVPRRSWRAYGPLRLARNRCNPCNRWMV